MLRPKLNRIWASSNANLRRDPGDAKYIQGWVSEIPTYQVLNYLQYKIDTTMLAMAERGISEWGSDVTYTLGSLAWDENDKRIYVSTVGSPDKTKTPSTNLSHWSPSSIQVTRASYDAIVASINAHIADVTGNPHQLTAGRLNAYDKTETDNIVAQYRALVLAHTSDRSNPHSVTALQVGAVPSTGGTYTGNVSFNAGVAFDASKVNKIDTTNGLFLTNGVGSVGINASGVGVVGTTGNLSPIVTELTFPTLKAAVEPSYAVPDSQFAMDLINSICLRRGYGIVTTNYAPQYSANNRSLEVANQTSVSQTLAGDSVVTSSANVSVAIDVLSPSSRNPSDTDVAVEIGMSPAAAPDNSILIQLTGASIIRAIRTAAAGTTSIAEYQLTGPVNTWYKVAATFQGNTIKLYLNGVLVATNGTASATATVTGSRLALNVLPKTTALSRTWNFRGFRVWGQALTDKQVSTL